MNKLCYVQSSPFSVRQKILSRVWQGVNISIFKLTPWFATGFRRFLLKLFGAKIANTASVSRTALIMHPWNLEVKSYGSIGDYAVINCYAPVKISEYAVIGQRVIIETGSHNINDFNFDFFCREIKVGKGAWICPGAIVLPGVIIGDYAVVGAGSVCRYEVKSNDVVIGNPATVLKKRYSIGQVNLLSIENESN